MNVIKCTYCGHVHETSDEFSDPRMSCSKCGTSFDVSKLSTPKREPEDEEGGLNMSEFVKSVGLILLLLVFALGAGVFLINQIQPKQTSVSAPTEDNSHQKTKSSSGNSWPDLKTPPVQTVDPRATATKNAWSALYRADTRALSQWENDFIGALETIINGYKVDSENVDSELLAFIDEHISIVGNLSTIKRSWIAASQKVERDAERGLQEAIDNIYRPLALLSDNPQKTLDSAIAGHRIGMKFDINNAQEKVNQQFRPKESEAWKVLAASIRAKSKLAAVLTSRYHHEFPVGFILKE